MQWNEKRRREISLTMSECKGQFLIGILKFSCGYVNYHFYYTCALIQHEIVNILIKSSRSKIRLISAIIRKLLKIFIEILNEI